MSEDNLYSLDTERAVLGCVLLVNETFALARNILKREHFYSSAHQIIWDVFETCFEVDKAVDLIIISDELKAQGRLDEIGGAGYLVSLEQYVLSPQNIGQYCSIVKEKWRRREWIKLCQTYKQTFEESLDEELPEISADFAQKAEQIAIDNISQQHEWQNLGDEDFQEQLREFYTDPQKHKEEYVESFFEPFNTRNSGYQVGEVTMLIGDPGAGKTLYASRELIHSSKNDIKTAMFTTEMKELKIAVRMIKQILGYEDVPRGEGYPSGVLTKIGEAIQKASVSWKNVEIIYMPTLTTTDITIKLKYLQAKGFSPKFIILDHFHQLAWDRDLAKGAGDTSKEAETMKRLGRIAGEFNAAFLVLGHPPKEMFGTILGKNSPKGSGALVGVAKTVITLSEYTEAQLEMIKDKREQDNLVDLPPKEDVRDFYIHVATVKSNDGQLFFVPCVYRWRDRCIYTPDEFYDLVQRIKQEEFKTYTQKSYKEGK